MDKVLHWEALQWYDTLGWLGGDGYSSEYVLTRLTDGLVRPAAARAPDAAGLDAASVSAWLEKLRAAGGGAQQERLYS